MYLRHIWSYTVHSYACECIHLDPVYSHIHIWHAGMQICLSASKSNGFKMLQEIAYTIPVYACNNPPTRLCGQINVRITVCGNFVGPNMPKPRTLKKWFARPSHTVPKCYFTPSCNRCCPSTCMALVSSKWWGVFSSLALSHWPTAKHPCQHMCKKEIKERNYINYILEFSTKKLPRDPWTPSRYQPFGQVPNHWAHGKNQCSRYVAAKCQHSWHHPASMDPTLQSAPWTTHPGAPQTEQDTKTASYWMLFWWNSSHPKIAVPTISHHNRIAQLVSA